MKVSLVLLTISLLIASYNAATINLDVTGGLACAGASGCTLGAGIFGGGTAPGPNDDVILNAGLFTSRVLVNVNSALTVRSVQIIGAGSQLVVQAGSSLTTAANVTVGASAQLIIAGSATINGIIAVSDGTATSLSTITISGSVVANGGIYMGGSNSQLSVTGGASLTISASSTLRGTINWASNAIVIIQTGTTTVYASFTASANVTVQAVLAVYASATATATSTYQLSSGFLYLGASAVVNASVAASGTGTVVSGTGIITGDLSLATNAQISIGNSPGTQTVNGNYQQDGTSTFNLEIASSSNYDRLLVRGNVALNGFLKCIQLNTPGKTESYRFITAGGTISGKYSFVTASPITQVTKYSAGNDNTNVIAYYNNNASAAVASIMVLAIACVLSIF